MKVRAELTGNTVPDDTLDELEDISTYNPLDKSNADSNSSVEQEQHETCNKGDGSLNSDMSPSQHRHPDRGANLHNRNHHRRRGRRGRGRGRGSPGINHLSNVTDRSHRRQSAYTAQAQLSDKDEEFLKVNKTNLSTNNKPSVSTSTPKSPPGYNSSQLNDSELTAMGIDPGTKYAEDVRRKYSAVTKGY